MVFDGGPKLAAPSAPFSGGDMLGHGYTAATGLGGIHPLLGFGEAAVEGLVNGAVAAKDFDKRAAELRRINREWSIIAQKHLASMRSQYARELEEAKGIRRERTRARRCRQASDLLAITDCAVRELQPPSLSID
jgi:hypothetical protein